MNGFLDALGERILIFDGAMGTQIHAADLSLDDHWGQENNSEILNLSRPEVIRDIHARYLQAGADCVETNTFGANLIVQGEYGNDVERVREMNLAGARLAREAVEGFGDGRQRWVVGSIGPGTQLPSLGNTTFDALAESYGVQARALLDGGVDALLIETTYDLLQAKAAVAACADAFDAAGHRVPLMVQVTIQPEGTMLLGSEIGAAIATFAAFDIVDSLGINCATGPVEMIEHVRALCQGWPRLVSVQPNAGLPEMRDGRAHYSLSVEDFVAHHEIFVREFGVNAVGGCCGTTPEFITALTAALRDTPRPDRQGAADPSCASLYIAQPFKQSTSFFVIGERCNAQGSRRFKNLVDAGDWDQTVRVAREQVAEGAHALDVSVDFVGRDGAADMAELISRFRTQVTLPLVIDSTEPEVIEAALKQVGGRPVINSINLEEGRGVDTRLERNLRAAKRYGAAVVAIAIDERGQASTAQWKLEACTAIYKVAVDEFGLKPWDIIFDCVVLPVSTGQEETRRAGLETLDGVEAVKKAFPDSFVSLGVSNVSFGLSPAARQVLNSVFLHEAVARGLDMAIVSPAQILPLSRIDEQQREAALDLLYDRRRENYDPLHAFIALFEGVEAQGAGDREDLAELPLEERLKRRIIDGNRDGLAEDLDEALGPYQALAIINDFLLEGMKVVGELFASGEMQLPFVLQSAETMKAAVAHLEPHMERVEDGGKGTIVLATVKGDVHDIGKNLVDIILTNNGYTVHNLGIKQPINSIIEAAQRHAADAIGLSGLLVKSTVVMREDLEELNRRSLHHYPVILGGAALTRSYVEKDLRELYRGRVFYGRDAFEGLHTMDALRAERTGGDVVEAAPKEKIVRKAATVVAEPVSTARSDVATDVPVPARPFTGSRIVKGVPVADIAEYLNRSALFRGRWEMRRKRDQSPEQYESFLAEHAEPVLRELAARSVEEKILQPAVVYGYFPAQSQGNDLIVYREDERSERMRFTFPRQQRDRRLCISDFFRPVDSGVMDVVAFHLVTMGARVAEVARELFESNRYQDYFFLHGFGVEMAEALAEYWHKRIREEMGIADADDETIPGLFDQGYRGSRYSFGYPACPNLEDQAQLFELLEPERIGVRLSEEFQLDPEQSTSAIIVHHPEAKYFSVGRQR
ncbi:MAG TPA: methionine synthase [Actinomycetota bacterium]